MFRHLEITSLPTLTLALELLRIHHWHSFRWFPKILNHWNIKGSKSISKFSAQEHLWLDLQERIWASPWEHGRTQHTRSCVENARSEIIYSNIKAQLHLSYFSTWEARVGYPFRLTYKSPDYLGFNWQTFLYYLNLRQKIYTTFISPRHGVVPRLSPLRLRALTSEEEASLKKIKKSAHSPISLMHICLESSNTSLSSILQSLVVKVAEQAPSLVVIRSLISQFNLYFISSLTFITCFRGAACEPGPQIAWPGYSHLVKSGWIIHHHVSLQVVLKLRLDLNLNTMRWKKNASDNPTQRHFALVGVWGGWWRQRLRVP